MSTTSNAEVVLRFRDTEFIEEHLRHVGVIMLSGMDNLTGNVRRTGTIERGYLHKVWSCACYKKDGHCSLMYWSKVSENTICNALAKFFVASPEYGDTAIAFVKYLTAASEV